MLAQIELWTNTAKYPVGVYFLPKKVRSCDDRAHLEQLCIRTELFGSEVNIYSLKLSLSMKTHFKSDLH